MFDNFYHVIIMSDAILNIADIETKASDNPPSFPTMIDEAAVSTLPWPARLKLPLANCQTQAFWVFFTELCVR
jgi:hypothetical protein